MQKVTTTQQRCVNMGLHYAVFLRIPADAPQTPPSEPPKVAIKILTVEERIEKNREMREFWAAELPLTQERGIDKNTLTHRNSYWNHVSKAN